MRIFKRVVCFFKGHKYFHWRYSKKWLLHKKGTKNRHCRYSFSCFRCNKATKYMTTKEAEAFIEGRIYNYDHHS